MSIRPLAFSQRSLLDSDAVFSQMEGRIDAAAVSKVKGIFTTQELFYELIFLNLLKNNPFVIFLYTLKVSSNSTSLKTKKLSRPGLLISKTETDLSFRVTELSPM